MAAGGFADDNALPTTGGTMTGPLELAGTPALLIPEGTNACMGLATLAGTSAVTITTDAISSATRVFLTTQAPAGTVGAPYVASITPGSGFTVKSTSGSDTSVVAWHLIDHA